jgi:hypothetical protein
VPNPAIQVLNKVDETGDIFLGPLFRLVIGKYFKLSSVERDDVNIKGVPH